MSTQKNHLSEMVLLSTQNIILFIPIDKKIFSILRSLYLLIWTHGLSNSLEDEAEKPDFII